MQSAKVLILLLNVLAWMAGTVWYEESKVDELEATVLGAEACYVKLEAIKARVKRVTDEYDNHDREELWPTIR